MAGPCRKFRGWGGGSGKQEASSKKQEVRKYAIISS